MVPILHRQVPATGESPRRSALTDEALMAMIQSGLVEGLELLHQRHAAMLRGVCLQVCRSPEDADELLMEILVETWALAARYDPAKGRPAAWLATLARRRAIDRLRERTSYRSALERLTEHAREPGEGWTHVHEEISRSERDQHLLGALATLPAEQQTAIRCAYHEQMTQREIANRTRTPLGTIRTRLRLGLRKMKARLAEFDDLPWQSAGVSAPRPATNFVADTRNRRADPILLR